MKKLALATQFAALALFGTLASAQTSTYYNSIPKPLPGNVASMGPEAYAFSEIGDGVSLTTTSGTVGQVSIVLSSWACQSGSWYRGTCQTTPGATFNIPITIKLYSVQNGAVGALLDSITQNFTIPYRPSSTPAQCDATAWYSSKDKACYHGLATTINVNFSGDHVAVPSSNGELIVTASFNTTDFGPAPIGPTACNTTSAGCPYDSLNVSTDSSAATFVGDHVDGDKIFIGSASTNGPQPVSGYTGYHPEISIAVNTNSNRTAKGAL